ncbi:MAG TPA: ATP-dependent DNA helicase [Alphaproteobacteria bacterium]|nr:ATP-dependent DNA helicase [Alphaproteobacteria bacterium]
MDTPVAATAPQILLPDADTLVVGARGGALLTADGELEEIDGNRLARRLNGPPAILIHARSVARRVGLDQIRAFDVLELFAFVHPASFCRPTPRGIAEALGLGTPETLEDQAIALRRAAERLMRDLTATGREERSDPAGIAWTMQAAGWPWAEAVLAALGRERPSDRQMRAAMAVWNRLPEWQGEAPPPPPGQHPVGPDEARSRLAALLGAESEQRPQQADYASAISAAFTPRAAEDMPNLVLAEAGTGVGKTLGYLAPATLWAEKNKAPVWISTYTRNLQHQIDDELERLFPRADLKARRVVLRKGRENYLCLLNLEEAARILPMQPQHGIAIGLMARWTAATRDGDMTGGDFPGWLADLVGRGRSLGLADRRGECIYSGCPHYSRCFIERSVRRARKAEIVIANHALVMVQAALGGLDDMSLPSRYVFDEGHHLFDAADGAFAGHLTGLETAEMRRWLIGAETGRASRARGLKRRIEDLLAGDAAAAEQLDMVARAARALPGEGWAMRVIDGAPSGPSETFLARVRTQVYARAPGRDGPYGLETEATSPVDGLLEAGQALSAALQRLQEPLVQLAAALRARLDAEADELDSATRQRIDAAARALDRRAKTQIAAWRQMLDGLGRETPAEFVDWFGVEREAGRDVDVGFYRHWVDPTVPFAASVARPAHGLVVTSATLTDGTGEVELDWHAAEARTGSVHLPRPALRAQVPSPFDYPNRTRVVVVTDVRKDDLAQVAAAYRELFIAAGGGGLGLFTAISRLKEVHRRIAGPLEEAGLPLYAQHLDGMDVATLVEIFRGEEEACLLGTDAVRDGVDVPGRSLRLIVFDRVPWPRPTILHRARREAFGRKRYDDMITRLRLKQAYGRLVRRADDQGVFVLLDPMMPSRLAGAFPDGVDIRRVGLAEAVTLTREFLNSE